MREPDRLAVWFEHFATPPTKQQRQQSWRGAERLRQIPLFMGGGRRAIGAMLAARYAEKGS